MCGIVGIFSSNIANKDRTALISPMLNTLRHRGPDGQSVWSNDVLSLGHARLAVLDVSSNGQQPMTSHCGRYTITFNGEIYNFEDLRKTLDGVKWRGTSDTEVLLAAISEWGLDGALQKVNGMFAFGLWDVYEEKLFLVRDFLGEKPLYFYENEQTVIFSSELRAIECIPEIELSISRSAITQYLCYGNIPWPESIYNEVSKMQPGSYICFSGGSIEYQKQYFSLKKHIIQSKEQPIFDIDVGIGELHSALSNSVHQRMVSDVPLGAFLSGGTDSSLIVALMQEQSTVDVKTFSIGFDNKEFDEASDARAVAKHLGTEHTELYVSSADSLGLVEDLGQIYDEPFADSSQIPTLLVSKLARKDVTVCLSGDGGDELFSGYLRYKATLDIWNFLKWIPFRRQVTKILVKIPPGMYGFLLGFLKPIALRYGREGMMAQKLTRFISYIDSTSIDELYMRSISHWKDAATVVKGGHFKCRRDHGAEFTNFHEKMLYMDSIDYLEGDILQKVDRASMWHSLEVRVPMIDLNVIATAWKIPLEVKVRGGISKWPLKYILGKYLPAELVDKKKKGFGVPIDFWLRNQLREWMQDHLRKETLKEQGVFDYETIHKVMVSHLEGRENNGQKLWDILMFQQWLAGDPKRIQRL
jgi:asparagine synthase (glutamine-hydrolysing)